MIAAVEMVLFHTSPWALYILQFPTGHCQLCTICQYCQFTTSSWEAGKINPPPAHHKTVK